MIVKVLFFVSILNSIRSEDQYGISSAALQTAEPTFQVGFNNLGEYRGQTHKGYKYKKTFFWPKHFTASWIEAKMICKIFDLELATFESLDEIDWIFDKVNSIDYFTSNDLYRYAFVDGMTLTSKSKSDWYWTNSGIKIPYDIPWKTGEPNNKDNNENCMSIGLNNSGDKLGFNDEYCQSATNAFICQKTVMTD